MSGRPTSPSATCRDWFVFTRRTGRGVAWRCTSPRTRSSRARGPNKGGDQASDPFEQWRGGAWRGGTEGYPGQGQPRRQMACNGCVICPAPIKRSGLSGRGEGGISHRTHAGASEGVITGHAPGHGTKAPMSRYDTMQWSALRLETVQFAWWVGNARTHVSTALPTHQAAGQPAPLADKNSHKTSFFLFLFLKFC